MCGGLYGAYCDEQEIGKKRKHRRRVRIIIIMAGILVLKAGIILCIVLL